MKAKRGKPALPVDIQLPECVPLENDTMFVTLPTLEELEQFWSSHKSQFEFACEGGWDSSPAFLRPYEWVFGTSKAAVVRTVMRWDRSGIGCEFYDWASADPTWHKMFFSDRDAYRTQRIERGEWSEEDEQEHVAECALKTPESYRGWWRFCNLPDRYDPQDWFDLRVGDEEVWDRHLPLESVAEKLQVQTFKEWERGDWELRTYDREGVDEMIRDWRSVKDAGEDYYGAENEDGKDT